MDESCSDEDDTLSGEDDCTIPLDVCEAVEMAQEIMDSSPSGGGDYRRNIKSIGIYDAHYDKFIKWCSRKQYKDFSEDTLMAYFREKSEAYKASSLWAMYSMLKATLSVKHNTDVGKYVKLLAFLKEKAEGYKPTESKSFTREEVDRFISEAPDEIYLLVKVALIIGIAGGCRREDLVNMTADNIQDGGSILIVKIVDLKGEVKRIFTVTNDISEKSLELYRKYCSLRPAACETQRLFYSYRSGKCTKQVVGINTFGRMPFQVATWLKLPNPASFTGHCFKKTAQTLHYSDTGRRRNFRGPKPTSVYFENSVNNQFNVVPKVPKEEPVTDTDDLESSTISELPEVPSTSSNYNVQVNPEIVQSSSSPSAVKINIVNCSNCTINFNI